MMKFKTKASDNSGVFFYYIKGGGRVKDTVTISKSMYYLLIALMVLNIAAATYKALQGKPEIHIHYMDDSE